MIKFYEQIKNLYNSILAYTNYFTIEDIDCIRIEMNTIINNAIGFVNSGKYVNNKNIANNEKTFYSIYDIYKMQDKIEKEIKVHNDLFLSKKVKALEETNNEVCFIGGKELNVSQKKAMVREEHSDLILSSAGTGKTTLLLGKVKYLLNVQNIDPQEILLLSYTNNAVDNIKERIKKETNKELETYTFHKFCLDIIKSVTNKVPKIYTNENNSLFEELLREKCKDETYFGKVLNYIFNLTYEENKDYFFTKKDYYDYLKYNPPITLRGERVKSYGELEIANFLFKNGINYQYEEEYQYETNNAEYGRYKPDFYLVDYDIYIEYFGIDKKNEVPYYFLKKHNHMNATEEYLEGIRWKRETHKKHNTKLIECFYYEKEDGLLVNNLTKHLLESGVVLKEINNEELWGKIVKNKNKVLENFVNLLGNCINLIKSNQITKEQLIYLNNYKSNKDMEHNLIMLEIVWPIYENYEKYLKENELYDFNDLIFEALYAINENKYFHNYKYVLVDEFQDISLIKIVLLNVLRKQKDYDLFCVGDDWQSIYNFNGGNIEIILDIQKYIGLCHIDTDCNFTYRYDKTRINTTNEFISKNKKQIRKKVKTDNDYNKESIIIIENIYEVDLQNDFVKSLNSLPLNSNVLLLGRYDRDKDFLIGIKDIDLKYDNTAHKYIVKLKGREDLNVEFLTIHKAKGLECDYSYIINNRMDKFGFPSRIEDDSFLHLLRQNDDFYSHSEERRLMYVALTRAKKQTFLLNYCENQSEFIDELKMLNCLIR